MKTHKDLEVWKDSLELTNEIYSLTKTFPKFERFGLSSQMERAAVSVTSNIAEGWKGAKIQSEMSSRKISQRLVYPGSKLFISSAICLSDQ